MTDNKENKDDGPIWLVPLGVTPVKKLLVAAWTHCGKRNNQEDRFIVCPNLFGEYALFGIFDGTVKEHASEFVHRNILDCFKSSPSFKKFDKLSQQEKARPETNDLLKATIHETYQSTDARLLAWCQQHNIHYSSTTAVTALIHLPTQRMFVAHIGDSRAVLGRTDTEGNQLVLKGSQLTQDHKPDNPDELKRIESNGGSLTYLHGGKPFIRGGDFSQRQHAMQLNYSRAFGGKDLKMYGLSAIPDILQVNLTKADKCLVLGSDGIWDVISAHQVVHVAESCLEQGAEPAEEICKLALKLHDKKGSTDNVTAIVVYFDRN